VRVVSSGTSPVAAKRQFTSIVGGMVERRTAAASTILRGTWDRTLAHGPRSGRVYRWRGRLIQASAPGEPPQERSGALRNTPVVSIGTMRTARGWRGTVEITSRQPYAPILVESGRVIGARVLELAMPLLRSLAWRRRF
jgi:hypothetical protein